MNQIVLAHELRHALQDQYADLHALLTGPESDFDDRRLAALSLYEGDATLVMERFLRARLGPLGGLATGSTRASGEGAVALGAPGLFDVPGAPPVVRDQLVQPYVAGLALARALWSRGGADALREAWQSLRGRRSRCCIPSCSSAARRRVPCRPVSRAPRRDAALEGVLGELLLRTLLEEGGRRRRRAGRRRLAALGRPRPDAARLAQRVGHAPTCDGVPPSAARASRGAAGAVAHAAGVGDLREERRPLVRPAPAGRRRGAGERRRCAAVRRRAACQRGCEPRLARARGRGRA